MSTNRPSKGTLRLLWNIENPSQTKEGDLSEGKVTSLPEKCPQFHVYKSIIHCMFYIEPTWILISQSL